MFSAFRICLVGDHLMTLPENISHFAGSSWCNKNVSGDIWHRYCDIYENTSSCNFFHSSDVQYIAGIPGMTSGVIKRKLALIACIT